MSRVRRQDANEDAERELMLAQFPKVKPSEKALFRKLHPDENIVRRKATEFRIADKKYAFFTDDYDACVYYLKEQHLKSTTGSVTTAGELIGIASSAAANWPDVSKHAGTAGRILLAHSPFVATCVNWAVPPVLTLYEVDPDDIFPLPRDAKSIENVKTVITDIGLPSAFANSAGDALTEGPGLKNLFAMIGSGISWWMSKPVEKPPATGVGGMARARPAG